LLHESSALVILLALRVTHLAQDCGLTLVCGFDVAGEFSDDETIIDDRKRRTAVVTVFHVQYPRLSAII
jgi:hypothetical protein